MRRFSHSILTAAALALLCAGFSHAVDEPAAKTLTVAMNQPTVIKDEGYRRIEIANPDVATASFLSGGRIAIEGRQPGVTELLLVADDRQVRMRVEVQGETTEPEPVTAEVSSEKPASPAPEPNPVAGDTTPTGATPPTDAASATVTDEPAPKPATAPTPNSTSGSTDADSTPPPVVAAAVEPPAEKSTQAPATAVAPEATIVTTSATATEAPGAVAPTVQPVALTTDNSAAPDLWVRVTVARAGAEGSGLLKYSLSYGNRGPGRATDVQVRNTLPDELRYVAGTGSGDVVYDDTDQELRWNVGLLEPGMERNDAITFQAQLTDRVPPMAEIADVATIGCAETNTLIASNTAVFQLQSSALVAVFAIPDVLLVKKQIVMPLVDVRGVEYQQAVDRLEGLGIVSGYPDRTFQPDKAVSRAEAAKMIVLAANLKDHKDTCRLTYVLSRPATVTLVVRDQENRIVATLVDGQQKPAGDHAVTWDGRNDDGAYLDPGQYQYEVTAVDVEEVSATLSSTLTLVPVIEMQIKGVPTFVDIAPLDWYAGYVAEAENRQYVRGYPDHTFRPQKWLTRAEATAIVVRALGLEKEAERKKDADTGFTDAENIPPWANGYVMVAATSAPKSAGQLIIGYPGNTFLAQKPIQRTEAAAMIERFIDRDVKRDMTIAGALSFGSSLTINGKTIEGGPQGQFRQRIDILPGVVSTIAVLPH